MVFKVTKPLIQAINRQKVPYIAQKIELQAFKSLGLEMKHFEGDVLQIKNNLLETSAHACSNKPALQNPILENISIEKINESICDLMKLGEGSEAKVYRIKDTDYVIRIPLGKKSIESSTKISFDISPQDKVNHCVATIGDCQVQKYIEGVNPMGYPTLSSCTGDILRENITKNEQIKKCILEKMSTDHMKKYYLQLVDAHRVGMLSDYWGENTFLNLKTGYLTAIDFFPVPDPEGIFFNSLMAQFNGYIEYTAAEQNKLVKNGLKSLLELVKEGKILPSEIDVSSYLLSDFFDFPKMKDEKYFEFIKKLADSFKKDKSIENINRILSQLM